MFKVLLVDDLPLWTDLMSRAFVGHPTIQIIGSVSTVAQLWEKLKYQQPDLLLLDLILGNEVTDLSLAKRLKQTYPNLRIVLLTSASQNALLIQEANQLGLDGYLSKQITKDELVDFLLKAEQGERVFSNDVKDVLININKNGLPRLTPREKEILNRIDLGMKRADIVKDLLIKNTNTYDSHVHHIKEKLGVKSTNELLRKAAELGYI
ncbi:response regulator transcription factor [Fibrella forsythiae]|uniref:Response regulator transcription factor n=1 Tax=Fibrella forsythiae TaxID=2817061 RepID=A0ABS3JJN3_9BACT|nr:response regulator transcription factor [Fibrella forsythiae]MBO0949636.1 response regulator transcription factor [Fibrella forsythiae]